jgi:hypothetical protein
VSKALVHNLIKPGIKNNYDFLTVDDIAEAVQGVYDNGEKILAILPMQFNPTTGEIKEVLCITEVEY